MVHSLIAWILQATPDIEGGEASLSSDSDWDSSSETSDFDDPDSISGHSDISLQLTDAGSVSGELMVSRILD